MSIIANIDVNLNKTQISSIEVIQILIQKGWSMLHDNYVSYLPLGDKDEADWQAKENMSFEQIATILTAKEAQKEIIGIMLTWQSTNIGCDFLFFPDQQYTKFSIILDPNRPVIALTNNYLITNFQWYLEKLLPPLDDAFEVLSFSCGEHH